jgi:hypothetical protein
MNSAEETASEAVMEEKIGLLQWFVSPRPSWSRWPAAADRAEGVFGVMRSRVEV